MESILARALEYTLKYWLKSFSRDQFKLQGRTGQLSNLDINGDALHASMGLPLALTVTTAKIGKLEIILPKVKNVQVDPIVLQIDRLDMVLEENPDVDTAGSSNNLQSPTSSGKGSGYGFADKISDGMTLQFQTVNLLLETSGGAWFEGGAAWATPMASITMRNLLLYTTNENWQVVNLKAARDFSSNKNLIYVFRKLEWESLSIDLLPHPDMFSDARLARPRVEAAQRDDDGAKRVFFGGERFLEGISGEAYITVQRTELNSPLGLEVQLHVTEVVCPALSEPGLRALLRFLTGLCVCLNRGDVDLKVQQRSVESAGHSLVSLVVDHVFLCVKDPEFRLELLMQSLHFSRASVSDGESSRNLSKVMIGGLFLRDTFSRPPCTLVQPSMKAVTDSHLLTPKFGENFCPPIYPLGKQEWQLPVGVPLISLHSLQVKPSPPPPSFTSRTVISCQPLMIHLQEESCLRIYSFLAEGIIGNPDAVLPDSSVNSFVFTLKELEISVPLHTSKFDNPGGEEDHALQNSFAGARLHFEKLFFCESPSLNLKLLNLEKDPACLSVWDGQPVDASLKKWTAEVSQVSLLLEPTACSTGSPDWSSDLWKCVEVKNVCIELAMASTDGNPLTVLPPPGGIVRIAVACPQFLSNSSVEQFIFVLDLYAYVGRVSEKISVVGKNKRPKRNKDDTLGGRLIEKVPSDTAVSLAITVLQLRFLEACSLDMQGMPLAQFTGNNLFLKATHRTLGGAMAVSSTLCWESVQVDCVSTEGNIVYNNNNTLIDATKNGSLATENGFSPLRAVFWIHNKQKQLSSPKASVIPFLDISTVHVIPFNERDKECHTLSVSACISGVRLGGGMSHTEALLRRFGIFGPDGAPSLRLSKGIENLSSGPLSKLLQSSAFIDNDLVDGGTLGGVKDDSFSHLGIPDDVDASIELQDWLFALEGVQEMAEMWWFEKEDLGREHRCWHMTFKSLTVKAKSSSKDVQNLKNNSHGMRRYPVEFILVSLEGLQTLKPQVEGSSILEDPLPVNGFKESVSIFGRMNLEVRMKILEDKVDNETINWMMENFKLSVKQPIEAVLTKDELQHLAFLCKSEVDSIGRLTAGILRLLKLEKSLGKEAMNKLSNLGIESFEKIFSSDKLSQGSKLQSITTLALLEEAVSDSQAKCAALITESSNLESSQAGASLESLAKGAVQFSRKFTVRELQDRWHSLLYDPVVSEEASSRIIEFERSASSLSLKFGRTGNSKDNKSLGGKRKSESVRSCYYALRKRICNEPFNTMDLSFLIAPNDGNYVGLEDEPLPGNCMLGNPISDQFGVQETNMNIMSCSFPQMLADDGAGVGDECTTDGFQTTNHNPDDSSFPVEPVNLHKEIPHMLRENQFLLESGSGIEELHGSKELPVSSLFSANDLMVKPSSTFDQINNDPENICSEFEGNQVFNSPVMDCGLSIWGTDEGLSASAIPTDGHEEKDMQGDVYALPGDIDTKSDHAAEHDVTTDSKLEPDMPCAEMGHQTADTEGYLVEITNTLMNDEPFFMDVDAKDVIDKSYFDGLSSFLASSPNNCDQDQMPDVTEAMASETQDNLANASSCLGELDEVAGSSAADGPVSCDSEALMLSSVLTSNCQFPELTNGIICCTLNTEDPEVPCNEDVFSKQLCPSVVSSTQHVFKEAGNPLSASFKDFSGGQKTDGGPFLVQRDQRDPGQSIGASQTKESQMVPEMGQLHPVNNCRVKCEDSSCVAPKTDGFLANVSPQTNSKNITEGTLQPTLLKERSESIISGKHLGHTSADSLREKPALCSDNHNSLYSFAIKQEVDALEKIKDHQATSAEVGPMDIISPEPVIDHPPPDLEELMIESDDDVPYFSDIEAMILDMDLDPDDQDLWDQEVARYQHEDYKKAIIRLEQVSHSYMQRAIASHGAFAILYGRHSKHYIKKPEILLGRTTEDFVVDIDLGREGCANKVSRRQAIFNLEDDGSFHLKNLGKCSVSINNKEVGPGQSLSLDSGCLIEIRGMPFIFETNQTCVKQYLNSKLRKSGGPC